MRRWLFIGGIIILLIIGSHFIPKNVNFGNTTFGSSLISKK